ncbi:MAG: NAD(P)-dependent oxidoreductase [Acidobacteria bacterium]|nr:NAD(P)-dependent oxidoreductase [Acidobacteriota bacterium]
MRVLVTGARGFLGSHLMTALRAQGADARAFAGDITDAAAIREAVAAVRPSIVFHLAAYGTTPVQPDVPRMIDVNVGGTQKLWDALDALDDVECRLVQTGSCGEYGPANAPLREDHVCRPTTPYTRTLHEAVELSLDQARRYGRELIVLRPFGPYGPGDRPERIVPHVIDGLLSGGRVAVSSGDQRRDYSYVSDHMRAFLLAATAPVDALPAVFNIGTGRPLRVRALVETIAALVAPDAIARVDFGAVPKRRGEGDMMVADPDAARRALGYEPAVTLEDGLARTIAWHAAQLRVAR